MFNVNSIATYIQQPDLINIELTEAIWTELGWSRKEECVRKIQSELIEDTDFTLRKIAERLPAGNSTVKHQYFLSYKGYSVA